MPVPQRRVRACWVSQLRPALGFALQSGGRYCPRVTPLAWLAMEYRDPRLPLGSVQEPSQLPG